MYSCNGIKFISYTINITNKYIYDEWKDLKLKLFCFRILYIFFFFVFINIFILHNMLYLKIRVAHSITADF